MFSHSRKGKNQHNTTPLGSTASRCDEPVVQKADIEDRAVFGQALGHVYVANVIAQQQHAATSLSRQ